MNGAIRELNEETGLDADPQELPLIGSLKKNASFLDSYVWKSSKQLELIDLNLQAIEVVTWKTSENESSAV